MLGLPLGCRSFASPAAGPTVPALMLEIVGHDHSHNCQLLRALASTGRLRGVSVCSFE
jgi:hypothetical protein